ncbi:MAG: hypothetical protein A2666_04450 [Parcubacteria group bacterium RIFCSPHIGHO2_01_FULL_47_10b]|nr:MAG: hypothetical protein A2666_04450 [Parcubacteria group bacterium RIFCSPHIGHO2_01_FULL_47_10b]
MKIIARIFLIYSIVALILSIAITLWAILVEFGFLGSCGSPISTCDAPFDLLFNEANWLFVFNVVISIPFFLLFGIGLLRKKTLPSRTIFYGIAFQILSILIPNSLKVLAKLIN